MAIRFIFAVTIVLFAGIDGSGQAGILTRAERSDYNSTSDYKDVSGFIDQLKGTY